MFAAGAVNRRWRSRRKKPNDGPSLCAIALSARRATRLLRLAIGEMTGQQCKSARRLLGWSREKLSGRLSGHPTANSIRNYERQWKKLQPEDLAAIRAEFETAGIEFGADGRKVRLHGR